MNFHVNRGDFLLKIRGGPWGGPWTGSMDRVHGVVHGPGPSGGPWTRSIGWSMDPGPCFVYVLICLHYATLYSTTQGGLLFEIFSNFSHMVPNEIN